jgi:hypothetical protein
MSGDTPCSLAAIARNAAPERFLADILNRLKYVIAGRERILVGVQLDDAFIGAGLFAGRVT